jgi:hypothetical protein
LERYGAGLKNYGGRWNRYEWCPIAREWFGEHRNIIAAHLVPYNMGEVNCDHLFGPLDNSDTRGHLFSLENGLPMQETFKWALDSGRIIIVPAHKGDRDPKTGKEVDFGNDKEPLKIQVLDKSLVDEKGLAKRIGPVLILYLHGRILEFRTDFRPSKQYL